MDSCLTRMKGAGERMQRTELRRRETGHWMQNPRPSWCGLLVRLHVANRGTLIPETLAIVQHCRLASESDSRGDDSDVYPRRGVCHRRRFPVSGMRSLAIHESEHNFPQNTFLLHHCKHSPPVRGEQVWPMSRTGTIAHGRYPNGGGAERHPVRSVMRNFIIQTVSI